jgi:predicted RNA binding protein YcfA (HicA-like mRNA interferase family)
MSPKQPVVNAKQIIKVLEKKGFVFSRKSGSHAIYINSDGLRTTVPIHGKKDLGKGLLRQIMKDANISFDELNDLL